MFKRFVNTSMVRVTAFVIICFYPIYDLLGQSGYPLQPVSGADGLFETNVREHVCRSVYRNGQYESYMYFHCDEEIHGRTVYLEVTYLDIGYGQFGVQYNSTTHNYERASTGHDNVVLDSHRERTAVFELTDADFRNAQNLKSDLRLETDGSLQMHILMATVYMEPTHLFLQYAENWLSPYSGPSYMGDHLVDANTLTGKMICGYQGWFRTTGDPTGSGWRSGWVHYAYHDFSKVTVDMWPDMSEYSESEKYPVPGWTHADGSQAYLFSSANKRTVLRHFQWMETYGIDGVAVQRFVNSTRNQNMESFRIPGYAREAANRTGRTFYIMYCLPNWVPDPNDAIDLMVDDWVFLVDSMKITEDDRYLHHEGKPVVGLYGFFSNWLNAHDANRMLDIFQDDGPYCAFLIGSGQWWWRSETATGWPDVFRRMDAWIPWNTGNSLGSNARTDFWYADKTEIERSGVMYIPLVFPGFSWDNLKSQPPGTTNFPRRKGAVLWDQLLAAKRIGAQAVYVAMFDEIDEGTAIFKVTNDLPVNHYFIDLEGLPSDFYLLMTGYGTKMMSGEVSVPHAMPDFAQQSQPSIPDIITPMYGDVLQGDIHIHWTSAHHAEGIDHYTLAVDQQISEYMDTTTIVTLTEGVHAVVVRSVNNIGNPSGWSETVVFTVEN